MEVPPRAFLKVNLAPKSASNSNQKSKVVLNSVSCRKSEETLNKEKGSSRCGGRDITKDGAKLFIVMGGGEGGK